MTVARRARNKKTSQWIALNFRSGLAIGCAIAAVVAAAAFAYDRYDTKTLKRTIRRDAVYCGVNTGLPGFSSADEKGNWSGFGGDFRRPEKSQFHSARRQGALHRITEAQGRRAGAQFDLDHVARNRLRPALRRRALLRRHGL